MVAAVAVVRVVAVADRAEDEVLARAAAEPEEVLPPLVLLQAMRRLTQVQQVEDEEQVEEQVEEPAEEQVEGQVEAGAVRW